MKLVLKIDTENQAFSNSCPCVYQDMRYEGGWCSVKSTACFGVLSERPDWCPLEVVEEAPIEEFLKRAPYFGTKTHNLQCFYCGLEDLKVEAGGIYYCPNPLCTGPGVTNWFCSTLRSYRDEGPHRAYVDEAEHIREANKYLDEHPELRAKVEKLFQRGGV